MFNLSIKIDAQFVFTGTGFCTETTRKEIKNPVKSALMRSRFPYRECEFLLSKYYWNLNPTYEATFKYLLEG